MMTLFAIVRVKANSQREARTAYSDALSCIDLGITIDNVQITTASVDNPENDELIEIDGESV